MRLNNLVFVKPTPPILFQNDYRVTLLWWLAAISSDVEKQSYGCGKEIQFSLTNWSTQSGKEKQHFLSGEMESQKVIL